LIKIESEQVVEITVTIMGLLEHLQRLTREAVCGRRVSHASVVAGEAGEGLACRSRGRIRRASVLFCPVAGPNAMERGREDRNGALEQGGGSSRCGLGLGKSRWRLFFFWANLIQFFYSLYICNV